LDFVTVWSVQHQEVGTLNAICRLSGDGEGGSTAILLESEALKFSASMVAAGPAGP
jgi:hypothetical protein